MEEFRLLPVRTSTGRVVKERKFNELIELGVSYEDAMNIILGKNKRSWADKLTYMSPTIYRGYGNQTRGIVQELKEPGKRNPKIRERIIHLTSSDHKMKDTVKTNPTTSLTRISELVKNQDIQDVEVLKDKKDVDSFDMDFVDDDVDFSEIDWNDPGLY